MSFVLEALKKQEAARDPEAAVSLARQHADRRRHRLWAGLFALAMAVNVAFLGWLFAPWKPAPDGTESPGPDAGVPASPAGLPQDARRTAVPESTPASTPASTSTTAAAPTPASEPTAEATPEPATAPPPRPAPVTIALADLPAGTRARFPGIAFSTHIYSEDRDLRAIVANGQRLSEGDRIRGLKILAITEAGVTLAFENYRVEVPIVTDW